MAKRFFAMKSELCNRRSFKSKAEARTALFIDIEGWCNPCRRHSAHGDRSPARFERLHSSLGYLTPSEFERRWRAENERRGATAQ